jgi:hypothetical protein
MFDLQPLPNGDKYPLPRLLVVEGCGSSGVSALGVGVVMTIFPTPIWVAVVSRRVLAR